jgi:hypothetical protein
MSTLAVLAESECCTSGSSRWWLVMLAAALFVVGFWLWSRRQSPAD